MNPSSFEATELASLPPDLDAMVRSEVAGGEKLRWVGQPYPGRMFASSIPIAIFGVFFAGFALFWMVTAAAIDGAFSLFGLPFLFVGLGMIFSPLWAGRAATRTAYAVTDRRAILWEPTLWSGFQVRSYGSGQLGKMTRNQRPDGSGDLIFEELTTFGPRGRWNVTRLGFFAIERVHQVEALIRSINVQG